MTNLNLRTTMISASFALCAHNEEKNILKLLNNIFSQPSKNVFKIKEVLIVSSSNDKTNKLIENFSKKNKLVRLIKQKKRTGKSGAVNICLKKTKGDIIIFISADNLPKKGALEKLLRPFRNKKVGATGGRPVPINDKNSWLGFTVHLIWDLHHLISLENPKLSGEMFAIRRGIVKSIPEDSAVDDADIEEKLIRSGFKKVYVPEAITYMKGPTTFSDLMKQRRRIAFGYMNIKGDINLSTYHKRKAIPYLLDSATQNPKNVPKLFFGMFCEAYARILASYDRIIGSKKHKCWSLVESTKDITIK